jgi:holo-[acyl-carrier protein] synthase
MTLKGIGVDIIEIERVREAVEKYGEAFLNRVFTDHEIKYCRKRNAYRIPELAVRFAAKEAYSKAIGTGIKGFGRPNNGINWQDVEITNDPSGKPMIKVKGEVARQAHVSLSHSRDNAVACVYVED